MSPSLLIRALIEKQDVELIYLQYLIQDPAKPSRIRPEVHFVILKE